MRSFDAVGFITPNWCKAIQRSSPVVWSLTSMHFGGFLVNASRLSCQKAHEMCWQCYVVNGSWPQAIYVKQAISPNARDSTRQSMSFREHLKLYLQR